jgi:hypothetical protein
MTHLNNIITEVAIALKQDKSLDKLIEKYGEEKIADAMVFITYQQQQDVVEQEDDYVT